MPKTNLEMIKSHQKKKYKLFKEEDVLDLMNQATMEALNFCKSHPQNTRIKSNEELFRRIQRQEL